MTRNDPDQHPDDEANTPVSDEERAYGLTVARSYFGTEARVTTDEDDLIAVSFRKDGEPVHSPRFTADQARALGHALIGMSSRIETDR